jgi:hypothetical protein
MDVELECAVYGEGTVFPVKIARNAKVSALQKAIVNEKKDVNHRFKVDPAKLTLYLAGKKEGNEIKWLKDDSNLDDLLRGDVDKKYMKMRSSWNLNDEELLGPDFMPKGKEIHVLVDLEDRGDFIFTQSKRQRMEPMLRSQWFLSDVKQLGHVELTMDEWLDMTYNGNVLSLKLKDEQFVNEEKRKAIGFRYFDMDFPVLLSKNEGMLQSVFIRPCYERILDLLRRDIKNRRPSIVITGNPGVGKSRVY